MGELKKRGQICWVRYYRNGRRHEESSHSDMREDAVRLLKVREGDVARGLPVTPKIGRLRFDEAAEDVLNDYRVNGKRSLDDVPRRFTLHLTPFFAGRRLSTVTTPDVRVYVAQRQAAGASNATVNRELTVLKRAFSLALQSGKLLAKPHIPMLRENNARTGFFEPKAHPPLQQGLEDPRDRDNFRDSHVAGAVDCRQNEKFTSKSWRRRPDLNRGWRFCSAAVRSRNGPIFEDFLTILTIGMLWRYMVAIRFAW